MNNVRQFGAVGDGIHKDTAAIQNAIDAGGLVLLPPGTYLAGTLYLKSNGGLFLEPGAVLLASPDREDYNADDFCQQNRVFKSEHTSGAHFIVAVEQENIVVMGGGRIDGNRQAFYGDNTPPDCEKHIGHFPITGNIDEFWRPAQMLFFCECANVRMQDVQLYNSPQWSCFLHGCQDAVISGLRILNDQRTLNGDGIDIDCCQRVAIANCIIDTGDDCITLRGNDEPLKTSRPCEFVTIANCILHTNCNAFRIGVGNGIVRHVTVSNIVFHHARTAITFTSNYSSDPTRGVDIQDISFCNLQMECERPINFQSQVCGTQKEPAAKPIRNIAIQQVTGTFTKPVTLCGAGHTGIHDIRMADMHLDFIGAEQATNMPYPGAPQGSTSEWNGERPDAAFYFFQVENVTLDNVVINWKSRRNAFSHGLIASESTGVACTQCDFKAPVAILDNAAPRP